MPQNDAISVSEFKQRCLELIQPEKLRRQPLRISRRGKIVAIVSAPIDNDFENKPLKGSVKILKPGWETVNFVDDWNLS